MLALGAGRAGRACRAREIGGHAWGSRAWRAGRSDGMGSGALGGTGAGARGAGAHWRAAAGGASVLGRADGLARQGAREAGARMAGSGAWGVRNRGGRRWARGLGTGRLGWPGLCTRCTRLDFQTGFRLVIFPESVNEHCSLKNKNFSKKINIY